MATRRKSSAPDSLELLLDTICNTFGGVLFMAILIAVLIRTSGKLVHTSQKEIQPKSTAEELYRADAELTRALTERESLVVALGIQRDLAQRLAPPEVRRELKNRSDRDAQKGEQLRKSEQAVEALAKTEAKIEEIKQELATLATRTQEAALELASAKEELEKEIQSRTQTSKLPRLRASTKQEAPLILRFGRLYVWHRYDAQDERVGINLEDMAVVGEGVAEIEVAPKPLAGTRVTGEQADQAAISQRLAQFAPGGFYFAIVVYPDSFDEFRHLKKALIESGFEYRLMPSVPGEQIHDRGGRGGMVQ